MPFDFKFPDVGEGIAEGEVIKWLVKEGDFVKEDQPLVQIETDKAVVDLPSPRAGKILKINFKNGEKVTVGASLVQIGNKDEKISEKEIEKQEKREKIKPKGQSVVGELEEAEVEYKPHSVAVRGTSQSKKILASPAVRKFAADHHINLLHISGSGPGGRVVMTDIEKNRQEEIPEQKIPVKKSIEKQGLVEIIPLKGIRKTIADRMSASLQHAASLTLMDDVDIRAIALIKGKESRYFEKEKISLTYLPFIIKAVIAALKEHPILNSSLVGEEIILKKFYNIGIAVDTNAGLMVPVIKNAEHKSVVELATELERLVIQARQRKIAIEDLKDSTFTITNYGSIAGKYATPILNGEEAGILGVGRIFESVAYEKNKIINKKMLPLSLTFNHKILDGGEASRFLKSLKIFLEDPDHLLIKIR